MKFAVVSLFPEMFSALSQWGVAGRALERGLWELSLHDPRAHASDRRGTVDDRPYGGGPGMVMLAPVLEASVSEAKAAAGAEARVIALTPQGQPLTDRRVRDWAQSSGLVLVAGRYEGFDERFLERSVDEEISLGDFVVSGGELPAMMLMDAVIRQLPGVLGHRESAAQDSFAGGLLDCPHYTRPEVYGGVSVPPVLLSGNHQRIDQWRRAQSLRRTLDRRPDLLDWSAVGEQDRELLREWELEEPSQGLS